MTDSLLQKVVKKSKELNKKDNHALSQINVRRTELLNSEHPNYLTRLLASELELILEPGEGMMPLDDLVVNYYCYMKLKVLAGLNSTDWYDKYPALPNGRGIISWSCFVLCLSAINGLKDKRQPLTRRGSCKLLKHSPLFSKVDFRRDNAKNLMRYAEAYRKEIYGQSK